MIDMQNDTIVDLFITRHRRKKFINVNIIPELVRKKDSFEEFFGRKKKGFH